MKLIPQPFMAFQLADKASNATTTALTRLKGFTTLASLEAALRAANEAGGAVQALRAELRRELAEAKRQAKSEARESKAVQRRNAAILKGRAA